MPESILKGTQAPRTDFSDEEVKAILAFTRKVVEATIKHERMTPHLPDSIAHAPAFGLFVTLKNGRRLRSCLGSLGKELRPLGEVLLQVARDAACSDPRFPTIGKDELPYLNVEISLMYDPQTMTAKGEDRLRAFQAGVHGLIVSEGYARGLLLPQVATEQRWDEEMFLRHTCLKAGLDSDAWQRDDVEIVTFRVRLLHGAASASTDEDEYGVRVPARAGQFYPGEPEEMNAEVDRYLALGRSSAKQSFRAVMLPHAGWTYCGETIGRTLGRVEVPDTVIILGPKHTPYGAQWSVPPHHHWQIPGAGIPIATELADDFLNQVQELECEEGAHRVEHGSEVLLPFLHRLNPRLRVLPVVLGEMSYHQTSAFAAALMEILLERKEPILLVISSDMNHFAPEPENRRLDKLALDAMQTGHPRKLYETVMEHDISMCGVIPAVVVMQALLADPKRPADEFLQPELVDYRTSAQAGGDTSSVVGYAGVVIN